MRALLVGMHTVTVSILLIGCATTDRARVQSLATGEVLTATYKFIGGSGPASIIASDGTALVGEYSIISCASFLSGTGHTQTASPSCVAPYDWAIAQGFEFNQPGMRYGRATVAGGGRILDLVYAVNPFSHHGYGVGKDNKGDKYKLEF